MKQPNLVQKTRIAGSLEEPLLSGLRVGDCFLSRERLTCHDKKRRLGVTLVQYLGHVGPVYIRDKVHLHIAFTVMLEGLTDHDRTKIGSANTDIDDRVN